MSRTRFRPGGLLVRHGRRLVVLADAPDRRRIRFAGGHAAGLDTAEQARPHVVCRLVFGHIGRPRIHAMDAGDDPPYGEWGVEGHGYRP